MINIEVTPEIRSKIESALAETKECLSYQTSLDPEHQDKEAIAEYLDHIDKLEKALETGIYNKTT